MRLDLLLNNLEAIQVAGNPEGTDIETIEIDSQQIKKNSLFVAIKGLKTDGHKYIHDAISKGAVAVILEDDTLIPQSVFDKNNCVKIHVNASRKALAVVSNRFYEEPSKKLTLIGITGTKGKSTTAYYVKHMLEYNGRSVGLIGTIANYIGDRRLDAKLTTPESNEINKLLKEMVDSGCSHCVMEVSSHALTFGRVHSLEFDYGIFTNITSDHLDFHQNFENYLNAKRHFFALMKPSSRMIVNIDDTNSSSLVKSTNAKIYYYGVNKRADFKYSDVSFDLNGTEYRVEYKSTRTQIKTKLIGPFNAYNSCAAFAVGALEGIACDKIAEGINNTPQVPGRFEVISKGAKKVIIDYSHTSDSLRQALEAIRFITNEEKPVYTVFGCGGDRDRLKRPIMGSIAENLSSEIIITSDNPRTEDPMEIIDDIMKGVRKNNHKIIEDRELAIKTAVEESEPDAVILIAGKGHEDYQEINGVRNFFSDKEIAVKYM